MNKTFSIYSIAGGELFERIIDDDYILTGTDLVFI